MAVSRPVRHQLRYLLLTVLAGLLAVLVLVPTATAGPASWVAAPAAAAAAPSVPELRWSDCGEGFECATARVPLDYDHPRGAMISLALIRLPASDPGRRIGSLFLNPGGPGFSGADFVRAGASSLFSAEVRARFDLVGFDPRGIIHSTPLRCFDTLAEAQAALAPFPFPVTAQQERIWVRADRRLARACAQRGGPILDHMATANVARDLDLLRRAVGDKQLTYAGFSYGSYLGAVYANLFPGKVRALVVDGAQDPIAWATGRGNQARRQPVTTRLRAAQGTYATLLEFFRLCDRGGPNCAFSQGDPRRRYARLAERLLAEPAQLPDGQGGTVPFTYNDLVNTTLEAMFDPSSWPPLAEFLQQLDTLTRPPATAVAVQPLRTRLGLFQQEDYPNLVEGRVSVLCSDSDNPANIGAWKRAADISDRRYPYFGRLWTWLSSICLPWPGRDADRYTGPFRARTANPLLIVGNRFDPATPYQGAVTLARLLPRSRLLTLDGWGHTSGGKSSCITAHKSRYLLTTRVPPRGTVCQPDIVPFAQPAAALVVNGPAERALAAPGVLGRSSSG